MGLSPRRKRLRKIIPKQRFTTADQTFTPNVAKRTGNLFAGSPIVQGKWDGSGTPDVVSFGRGTQVHNNFYECFDPYQGTVVITAWTPEKVRTAGYTTDEHLIDDGTNYLRYEHDNQVVQLGVGGQTGTNSETTAAGTAVAVCARYDAQNTLDGTNYIAVSTDDAHTFAATSAPNGNAPAATLYAGSSGSGNPANALLEGVFFSRLPLYDGSYGIDLNGSGVDIINTLYNGGSYEDLARLIPAWHIPFCLPTNASTGALGTTGEAWGWDYSANVLGTGDGYCATTYGSSGWSTEGTPSTGPADFADDTERVFGAQGYYWTCDAADEGISIGLSGLSAGQNYLLVVDVHVDDANDVRIDIIDDTNGGQLTNWPAAGHDFGASSTRTTMAEEVTTFELPTTARHGVGSDCTAITIKILGTAASQTVYLHQVLLYENLIDNPSFEHWQGSSPDIPTAWTNSGLDATPDDIEPSAGGGGVIHSGSDAVQFNTTADAEGIYCANIAPAIGDFLCVGAFFYGDGSASGGLRETAGEFLYHSTGGAIDAQGAVAAAWDHQTAVVRATTVQSQVYIRASTGAVGNRYVDDAYAVPLSAITLTVTPASEANSAEAGGLRIDGYDTCTAALKPQLARNSRLRGALEVGVTPRHAIANVRGFGQTTEGLIACREDGFNYVEVYRSAAHTVEARRQGSGAGHSAATWNATGQWAAGTKQTIRLRWGRGYVATLVDGVEKIVVSGDFALASDVTAAIDWMTLANGTLQADAVATEG